MASRRPLIGITADVAEVEWNGRVRPRAQSALAYADAVAVAGATPLILPPIAALADEYVARLDGFVLSGGDDPIMEAFGGVTHPRARPMHPRRQEFEVALLRALDAAEARARPVLGVCLGMQLMALHAGARLDQCLAESLPTHDRHTADCAHEVAAEGAGLPWLPRGARGPVASNHRQAVSDAGRLLVAARADDGVIEAVVDPARRFYVGVQWHPERTPDARLGAEVFGALVRACAT